MIALEKVLLHCCCAPCSVSCVEPLLNEGYNLSAFWFNPNIHPFKEYEARRDCLINYMEKLGVPLIVKEKYGLREFVKQVAGDIDNRCAYCYTSRLEETAKYASQNGFDGFSSTLFASIYQNHDLLIKAALELADKYNVKFVYKDFRPNFRAGNLKAKELGFYMQKYCGCIFSEEDRYTKQINRDKQKFL